MRSHKRGRTCSIRKLIVQDLPDRQSPAGFDAVLLLDDCNGMIRFQAQSGCQSHPLPAFLWHLLLFVWHNGKSTMFQYSLVHLHQFKLARQRASVNKHYRKEVIALEDGYRESTGAWKRVKIYCLHYENMRTATLASDSANRN